MAAYHKVEVSLNTNAVEVGIPSPQTVNVTLPTIGPAGPTGSVGPVGPQGPQGVPGTGLEVLTTQGDILYQGASTGQRLGIGTAGQILKVNSGGTAPEWGAAPASGVSSVNGESGTVILDGSDLDTSGNDDLAAFVTYEFADGNGTYYPLPDSTLNSKRVYRNTTGHHVFFQSLRWHITDGSPITANIIESSDDDNAAWPWLSAWDGSIEKAKLSTIVGRARSTFLFVGDSIPNTSVSGLGTAATSDSTAFAAASHTHTGSQVTVGTTANLPLKTGTNGVVEAGSFGTAAGTFCEGNDARLSDDRDPNLHAASHAAGGSDPVFDQNLNTADSPQFVGLSLYGGDLTIVDGAVSGFGNSIDFENSTIDGFGGTFQDDAFFIADQSDDSKKAEFDASEITTGTTRTFSFPDASGTLALQGSITASGLTQATSRILGRTTASTGAVEEITIGTGLSLSAGELSATGGSGGGEVRSDFVSPYTYTGLADAGTSESTANWTIRRSEYNSAGTYVATLTASAVQWANRLTASYA